ncbi:MAG: PilC/PilY family type IV pilus protein [Deltaproteobacteria bacterium]|nr:PilC/PilY family type IV pilus protein [Deltaproteobacteria bacterium]
MNSKILFYGVLIFGLLFLGPALYAGPGMEEIYTLQAPAKPNVMIFLPDSKTMMDWAYPRNSYVDCTGASGCPAGCFSNCPRRYFGLATGNVNFTSANCNSDFFTNTYKLFPQTAQSQLTFTNTGTGCIVSVNAAFYPGYVSRTLVYKNYTADEFNYYFTTYYAALLAILARNAGNAQLGYLRPDLFGNDYRYGHAAFNHRLPITNDGRGGSIRQFITSNNQDPNFTVNSLENMFLTHASFNRIPKGWFPIAEAFVELRNYFQGIQPYFSPDVAVYPTPWGNGSITSLSYDLTNQSYLGNKAFILAFVTQHPSQDQDTILGTIGDQDGDGLDGPVIFPNNGTHYIDDVAMYLARYDMIPDSDTVYSASPNPYPQTYWGGRCPYLPTAHQTNCRRQNVATDIIIIGDKDAQVYELAGQYGMGKTYKTLSPVNADDTFGYDCQGSTNPECLRGVARAVHHYFNSLWSRNVDINETYWLTSPVLDVDPFEPWDCNANRYIATFFTPTTSTMFEGHVVSYRFGDQNTCPLPTVPVTVVFSEGRHINSRSALWDAGSSLGSWIAGNPTTSRRIYTSKGGTIYRLDNASITASDLGLLYNGSDERWHLLETIHRGIRMYWEGGSKLVSWTLGDVRNDPVLVGRPNIFYTDINVGNLSTGQQIADPAYANFTAGNFCRPKVLYMGANDGQLHAIYVAETSGCTVNVTTGAIESPGTYVNVGGSGREIWSYVPSAVLSQLREIVPSWAQGKKYFSWDTGVPYISGVGNWDGGKYINSEVLYRRYFVDATPQVSDVWIYSNDNDTTKDCPWPYNYASCEWKTYLVSGLGLGGRSVFALDVTRVSTDVDNPVQPVYVGEFNYANPDNVRTSRYLAFTTSTPVIGKVKICTDAGGCESGGSQRERWVAIFGAGYAPESDPTAESGGMPTYDSSNSQLAGRALLVLDLKTMQKLWEYGFDPSATDDRRFMRYALAAQVKAYDKNGDGYIDTVYAGDLGGQVWRFDLSQFGVISGGYVRTCGGAITGNCWRGDRLFAAPTVAARNGNKPCSSKHCQNCAGCGGSLSCGQRVGKLRCATNCSVCSSAYGCDKEWQSFWAPPSIAPNSFEQVYIFIGAGDKSNVLYKDNNKRLKFYGIRDVKEDDLTASAIAEDDLSRVSNPATAGYDPDGWYFEMNLGEKVITAPVAFNFNVFITTFVPRDEISGTNWDKAFVERAYVGDTKLRVVDFLTGGLNQITTDTTRANLLWSGLQIGRGLPSKPQIVTRKPGTGAGQEQGSVELLIQTSTGQYIRGTGADFGLPTGTANMMVGRIIFWLER